MISQEKKNVDEAVKRIKELLEDPTITDVVFMCRTADSFFKEVIAAKADFTSTASVVAAKRTML